MNCEKLRGDEVPHKFTEWLLGMGCPPEKVPSVEKISEMCRGQYYMVWRSLMEHVEAKDKIKQKRLQVFCDDVQKWSKKSPFSERDNNAAMPEQLALWQQHTDLKEKVADAEARVISARERLKQLTDKISMKMSHRNISRRRVEDLQRRTWLLQQVAEDLKIKKENLLETRSIADSLCSFDEEVDVQSKLEKCMNIVRRQSLAGSTQPSVSQCLLPAANSTACSSGVFNGETSENEEQVSSLVKCRGDALWPQLHARRAALVPVLAADKQTHTPDQRISPQSVIAHTAALHCNLVLEAMKNQVHIKHTQKQLAANVDDLSNFLTGEACELLVLRSERAHTGARVSTLRTLLDEMTSRSGIFSTQSDDTVDKRPTTRQIAILDKSIESKREELKKLIDNLSTTEKKIQNIRECLCDIFNGFQNDLPLQEYDRYKEEQVSSLVKCRGDALWPQLHARRAALVPVLAADKQTHTPDQRISPQSVIAHTAALHCNLVLEAMKNQVHIKHTQKQLAANVDDLSNFLTGEACELLVLRSERAHTGARVSTLRTLLDEMTSRSGIFSTQSDDTVDKRPTTRQIAILDKSIESKREELKKLIDNLSTTEKKIQNIRECLCDIFNGFQNDLPLQEYDRYKGQLDFPRESIVTLRKFYEERREKGRNKIELSLNLDISDNCSFTDPTDNDNSRFVDELRIYLKKFNLEKNRKLVLETGEKIWIFETIQAAVSRLHSRWQQQDLTSPVICSSVNLPSNLQQVMRLLNSKEMMETMVTELDISQKMEFCIDIASKSKEEDETRDKIKKRLNENILSLQKTSKTLEIGEENLKFWSDNQMRKYISNNRTFDGKTYKDYEANYHFNNFV